MSNEFETPAVTPPAPEAAAPERIRRGRIGLNVTVQIILGVILFAMVNVLAHRRFKQWDYTYSRSFSLAGNTQKFIDGVKEPVRVTVLAPRESPVERDITPMLDQYRLTMAGRMEVEYIDTKRDVAAWENFKNRLYKIGSGLRIETDGVFVQSERPHKSDTGEETYFHKWIPAESLYLMDKDKKVPLAFRGESYLNTAIAAVTDPERPRIGIVTGMGRVRGTPQGTVGHVLTDICSAQNIDLEGWRMLEYPEDIARYKALVFVGTNLFGEQQDALLTKFFETPGNGAMVLLDPEDNCVELNNWLNRYGIDPQDDRVLTARSTPTGPDKQYAVDARFLDNSPITETLMNQATLLPRQTRSLKMLSGLQKQRDENIQITPLLTPGEFFWGEKDFSDALPQYNAKEENGKQKDSGKPLFVAAALERGAASDPRLQMQSSRLVVAGNAAFAEPPVSAPNYDFITRSLNWILHRDVTAANDSSTDKAKHRFSISISPAQWQRVMLITTVVLPLTALMAGLVIWSTRRH